MSRATSCATKAVAAPTSSILTRLLAGASAFLFAQLVNIEMPEAARVASRPGTPQRLSISANKLIQAKDMHGVVMVQSEFFQEQMRALTDQT